MDLAWALLLGVVPFLAGAGMLVYVWWCWSGRSRRWATRAFINQLVYAILPGLGLFLIAAAVKNVVGDPAGDLLVALATAVGLLGFVALLLEPRWYHDLQASNSQPDLSDRLTAVWVSSTAPAPFSSDLKAAQAFGETPVARWRGNYVYDPDDRHRTHGLAVPGAVAGHLNLYPGGLTFAANATEDSLRDRSTVVVVPAHEVTGARVVPARAGTDGSSARACCGALCTRGWWSTPTPDLCSSRSPAPRPRQPGSPRCSGCDIRDDRSRARGLAAASSSSSSSSSSSRRIEARSVVDAAGPACRPVRSCAL